MIADQPDVYLTIAHFAGYAAVLARLGAISDTDLHELVVDAWLVRAPKKLARELLGG